MYGIHMNTVYKFRKVAYSGLLWNQEKQHHQKNTQRV